MFLSRVYCTIYYIFQAATLTLCCLILQVRGRRHLLFASQQQLEVLCRAKAWYIDGTFKLCRKLFSQLLIINAFVHIYVFICIFLIFFSGKSQLPLYMLIQLLHGETTLQVRMVSEHKLCRLQRRTYRQLQAKIFSLWDQYENGDRTAKQLLRACSELYGPRDC